MKKLLIALGGVLVLLMLAGVGFYAWASIAAGRKLSRTYTAHTVDFPVPFPLSDEEVRRRRLTPEAASVLAREQALERGAHLVESRYGCGECHGRNFGGGVMVDAPPIGRLLGPNITAGRGSKTAEYRVADWDRIVRHGLRPDGRPAFMPSDDFRAMTDQELSDIIVFLQSQPPVDHEVAPVKFGPVGKVLVATGALVPSAAKIESHDAVHEVAPPEAAATVEFGRHLANVCSGRHQAKFAGGPIAGGDPSWAPARNLTPHATGLAGWTYDQFVAAMREGKRPDGTALKAPMSMMAPYAQKMTEVEMQALWAYLGSLPPVASQQ